LKQGWLPGGVVLALVLLCVSAPADAQSRTPQESTLLAAIARTPAVLGNYLDLVKLYAEEHRYDEAERMLARAGQVLRLAQSRPQPSLLNPVRGGVPAPTKIKHVDPVYPVEAQRAGVTGVVIIEVTIDAGGSVARAKVLRSVPLLDAAALDAVRQWKYKPTMLNGAPISIVMTVTVTFAM
jgi:protein TonB